MINKMDQQMAGPPGGGVDERQHWQLWRKSLPRATLSVQMPRPWPYPRRHQCSPRLRAMDRLIILRCKMQQVDHLCV
jgi:hypothetical protein